MTGKPAPRGFTAVGTAVVSHGFLRTAVVETLGASDYQRKYEIYESRRKLVRTDTHDFWYEFVVGYLIDAAGFN